MHHIGPTGRGWCVVVADDDSDWRSLMSGWFRRSGYEVVEAADGDELVTLCRSLDADSDRNLVVVSDIDMPGRSGIEAANDLRSLSIAAPILFVTGARAGHVVDAAHKAGARAVVQKPVSGERIVSMVNRICDVN